MLGITKCLLQYAQFVIALCFAASEKITQIITERTFPLQNLAMLVNCMEENEVCVGIKNRDTILFSKLLWVFVTCFGPNYCTHGLL